MQIIVMAVGKAKEKYWREALAEYAKRLSAYVRLDVVEVEDEAVPENASVADHQRILRVEADRLRRHLRDRDAIIALDRAGHAYDSEAWSREYDRLCGASYGRLVFIIGGSLGLDGTLLADAAVRWSFGPLTLPHQLARVVLLEQLYRGIRISRGEPYHR